MKNLNKSSIPAVVISIALALALVFSLAACGNNNSNSNSDTTTSPSTTDTGKETTSESTYNAIIFDEQSLIKAYCAGKWDGSFITDKEHCASIEDGQLWIDCDSVDSIPDMGPHEDCFWYEIISSDANGTWVYDTDLGLIELWYKGTRFEKIVVPTSYAYYTSVYKLESALVARYGETLWVYTLEGYDLDSTQSIVDCYQKPSGEFLFSTFENKNYEITSSGEIVEMETTYVRFPRSQRKIVEAENKQLLTQAFNLFYGTDWDGSCKKINDNDFIKINYNGNVISNNKWIGNVSFGTEYIPTESGVNMSLSDETSYWLNGTDLITFCRGEQKSIDIPDGEGEIRWVADNKVVIWLYNGTLVIVEGEEVHVVSTAAIDMNVAYDTLYFMEGDTVYSLDWENGDASPEIYFEGAYAVSPHEDEAEGAIVPSQYANDSYYGYSNLYVPI